MSKNKNFHTYDFTLHGDERGALISLEENKNIPFDIKRVYYIFNTKEKVKRGCHAHKVLRQVLVCVSGSCKVLLDDGSDKEEILLNSPNRGLLIDKMVWREMFDFSSDCVLIVLASEYYDPEDYIVNYDDFIKVCKY